MTDLFANPSLVLPESHDNSGKISWESPSNIALIKYWGKKPVQIPANASISYTLSHAKTTTSLSFAPQQSSDDWITFTFEGKEEPNFAKRIEKYFSSITSYFPFLSQLSFVIKSKNSFPHSSGIASSASSMSALALCLCDMERVLFDTLRTESEFLHKASFIARLGSGSAARSVYPLLASWGEHKDLTNSSDLYASPYDNVHETLRDVHDDVVIVSGEKKSVSSTAGHALMDTNPFAHTRYEQASSNMTALLKAMSDGDIERWGHIVESEAMTLHALMMCSDPSYILMKPKTLAAIDRIRAFRQDTKLPVYFTLDAGPNVHVLYPHQEASKIKAFISSELLPLAERGLIIPDRVGQGPEKVE